MQVAEPLVRFEVVRFAPQHAVRRNSDEKFARAASSKW
jgi:hypothetical protein